MRFHILAALLLMHLCLRAAEPRWVNGPPADPTFFPIAVWVQHPNNAARYKAAGINTYVGLWKGPTEAQLNALAKAGLKVVCEQNAFALTQLSNPAIIAWMHGDEPDNAQSRGEGKGYGPPILPEKIVSDYERIRANDPTRPVFLNLGQGVAYDNYIGRGVRRNRMEDYPLYLKGCDIASFDIYPANHDRPEIAGKLEFVPRGVTRLIEWSGGKTVWNCIETTSIRGRGRKPAPEDVRSEVWMSLIHGSRGIIYFVHEFAPFREAGLLHDREMLAAVTKLNRQILRLAPVLNSPALTDAARVESTPAGVPVALTARRHDGALYLFAAAMRRQPVRAKFTLPNHANATIEILDENRSLHLKDGSFEDDFPPYGIHLYRIR